jgi:hypothetical protein
MGQQGTTPKLLNISYLGVFGWTKLAF